MDDGSGRYLIYRLLHRQIRVVERNGKKAKGEVKRVYRDIMSGVVRVTVGGREISFAEPNAIRLDGEDVVFSYGRTGLTEDSDTALWTEVRSGANTGESVDDVLKRTSPVVKRETRFYLEPALA
jgi:hypothetical protein